MEGTPTRKGGLGTAELAGQNVKETGDNDTGKSQTVIMGGYKPMKMGNNARN